MVLSHAAVSTDGMQECDPQPLIQLQRFLPQYIPVRAECSPSWHFNLCKHQGLVSEPTAKHQVSSEPRPTALKQVPEVLWFSLLVLCDLPSSLMPGVELGAAVFPLHLCLVLYSQPCLVLTHGNALQPPAAVEVPWLLVPCPVPD